MRICTGCQREQPESEFQWKNRSKGQLHYKCKSCFREANREWYRKHKIRKKAYRDEYQLRNRRFLYEYLVRHPCSCGESDPACLDFDHLGGKTVNVSEMMHFSMESIQDEIAKCVVRCSNCHRKKTAQEQGWYRAVAQSG